VTYVALESLTWPEAGRLGAGGAVGLVALASLEQHGPHLPLATDALIAERVAHDVAELLPGPVLVAPVARAGLSTHHLGFPGTVTVPPEAYLGYVLAALEGLERTGVRKLALFSWHGGNFGFVGEAVGAWRGGARLAGYADLAGFLDLLLATARAAGLAVPDTDIHAGGLETSMMLAAFAGQVRPFDGVEGYTAAEPGWLERLFAEGIRPISETGVLGDLRGARADVGDALFAAVAAQLAGFFSRELELG
jgi:creatinine amidohydrolase